MYYIAWYAVAILAGKPRIEAGSMIRRKWLLRVPIRLGLDMRMEGTPYKGPCLYVGNHISYIDPVVVLEYVDANVVAKAEVSRWPLVGLGVSLVGTIWVQRDERSSRLEAVKAIKEALEQGISILVFPEGTTSAGPGTLPFRPRSFEAANLAGVPVQPFAILYESPDVAYIGNHTFFPHFFKLFRMKYIRGRIAFGDLLYGENTCEEARQWIEETQYWHGLIQTSHEPA